MRDWGMIQIGVRGTTQATLRHGRYELDPTRAAERTRRGYTIRLITQNLSLLWPLSWVPKGDTNTHIVGVYCTCDANAVWSGFVGLASARCSRPGKIMRRILRKIAEGEADKLGDTSTLADPSIVDVSSPSCIAVVALELQYQ